MPTNSCPYCECPYTFANGEDGITIKCPRCRCPIVCTIPGSPPRKPPPIARPNSLTLAAIEKQIRAERKDLKRMLKEIPKREDREILRDEFEEAAKKLVFDSLERVIEERGLELHERIRVRAIYRFARSEAWVGCRFIVGKTLHACAFCLTRPLNPPSLLLLNTGTGEEATVCVPCTLSYPMLAEAFGFEKASVLFDPKDQDFAAWLNQQRAQTAVVVRS